MIKLCSANESLDFTIADWHHNYKTISCWILSFYCRILKNVVNTCNVRTLESFQDVTPVETWSSKATGSSAAAYFVYNIRACNFLGGPVTFQSFIPIPPASGMNGYKSLMLRLAKATLSGWPYWGLVTLKQQLVIEFEYNYKFVYYESDYSNEQMNDVQDMQNKLISSCNELKWIANV